MEIKFGTTFRNDIGNTIVNARMAQDVGGGATATGTIDNLGMRVKITGSGGHWSLLFPEMTTTDRYSIYGLTMQVLTASGVGDFMLCGGSIPYSIGKRQLIALVDNQDDMVSIYENGRFIDSSMYGSTITELFLRVRPDPNTPLNMELVITDVYCGHSATPDVTTVTFTDVALGDATATPENVWRASGTDWEASVDKTNTTATSPMISANEDGELLFEIKAEAEQLLLVETAGSKEDELEDSDMYVNSHALGLSTAQTGFKGVLLQPLEALKLRRVTTTNG